MRSGTSFFDWTVFKKTVCRFWPLWGAYFVIWLVILPLQGLMLLRLEASAVSGVTGGYLESFARYTVPNVGGATLAMGLIFGVLAAMAVFSHLYASRSANLFGSLPVRREGLFATHYLAGLCFLIVPNAAIFLLTLLVEAVGGAVFLPGLGFWLVQTCGEGFFFYSLAVFCAMFTGHILALPAFYAIANCLFTAMTTLAEGVLQTLLFGFVGFPEAVGGAVDWLTPVNKLAQVRSDWETTNSIPDTFAPRGLDVLGIYAAAGLLLAVCAFLLYRARRLESAGDVVAVRPLRPVFKYGVAVCAGLALGVCTSFVMGGGEGALIASIVVWGVIGCFAAQMLLDKSFRVFKKWKGPAAVGAAFLALFLALNFDLTGFETRVPAPEDVSSVYVEGLQAVWLRDDGDNLGVETDDPEVIELLTRMHRAAIGQRGGASTVNEGDYERGVMLDLAYHLKNGSSLSRRYTLMVAESQINVEGSSAWCLQELYDNRDLYWRSYGFEELETRLAQGDARLSVELVTRDEVGGDEVYTGFYGQDAQALLAAVKEDFYAGRIGARDLSQMDEDVGVPLWEFIRFNVSDPKTGDFLCGATITLLDTADSTKAALTEMAPRGVVTGGGGVYYGPADPEVMIS